MADYILTYTKIRFYPTEPIADDIRIEDIAHALSMMTRANGHFATFYSVAQHSLNCYKEAKSRNYTERVQLGCLLHDASEAYLSDITRPVKRNLPAYFAYEDKLQGMIFEKFGLGDLTEDEKRKIKSIDDALLYYEFYELMGVAVFDEPPVTNTKHDFAQREFGSVENEFLNAFEGLT
jgi:hypothetical protein